MSTAYAEVEDLPALLTSADIDRLFQREPGWFAHHRVRQKLYRSGFPHPVSAGRWSPIAVKEWMRGAGRNPDNLPPSVKRRRPRRRTSHSGYAPA